MKKTRKFLLIQLIIILTNSAFCQVFFEETTVFQPNESGYACFRIPAIIASPNGDLLAFSEGRVNSCSDHGNIDLVMKRSTNNGETWGSLEVIMDNGPYVAGNPGPVVDYTDANYPGGRIFVAYNTSITSEGEIRSGNGIREIWIITSTDNAQSWSEPENITMYVNKPKEPNFNPNYNFPEDWRWYAVTPGHCLQITLGDYAGRLVFPCNHSTPTLTATSHAFYTDDNGQTWQLGEDVGGGSNEATACELSNGDIMINSRTFNGEKNRNVALSSDGGFSWSEPFRDPELPEPRCEGSIINYYPYNALLFTNPGNQNGRENLTIKMSLDDGENWILTKQINEGFAAYSDLVIQTDTLIGVLYETQSYGYIKYAKFNRDWLLLPDTVSDCNNSNNDTLAMCSGDAISIDRTKNSQSIKFNGTSTAVTLDQIVDNSLGNFTIEMWFKSDIPADQLGVFYWEATIAGVGVWLRSEPANNRIRALVGSEPNNQFVVVVTTNDFNDNQWHHLALVASNNNATIYVDGNEEGNTSGNITSLGTDSNGNIGEGDDGRNKFTGLIDKVRIWHDALDAATLNSYMFLSVDENHPNHDYLVLDMDFDEEGGNKALDFSGESNHGVVNCDYERIEESQYNRNYSYTWLPGGQTTGSITVNPDINSDYSVTISDSDSQIELITELTHIIVVEETDTPEISGDNLVVLDGLSQYSVEANYGSDYQWACDKGSIIIGQGSPFVVVLWTETGLATLSVIESYGCESMPGEIEITVVDSIQTSIKEFIPPVNDEIRVFPNPGRNKFYFEVMSNNICNEIQIVIYHMNGSKLHSQNLTTVNNNLFHLVLGEEISNGIYLVNVLQNKHSDWVKLMVNN